jgi:hypothetical protein
MSTVRAQTEATPRQAARAARPPHTTDARAVSVAGLLALQRAAGNRAVTRLLQRATPGPPGAPPGPPHRPLGDIVGDYNRAVQEADHVRRVGEDLVEEAGLGHPLTTADTIAGLEELERRGDKRAADLLRALREAEEEQDRLFEEWLHAQQRFQPPGGAKGGAGGKEAEKTVEKEAGKEAEKTVEKEAGKEAEKTVEKEAGKQAEKTVVKEAGKQAEKTVVKEAAKQAEKTVVKEAAKQAEKTVVKAAAGAAGKTVVKAAGERAASLFKRVAAKVGLELLDALVPNPLDALELMVDFAESFTKAREAIRQRNLENGFAIGWAAYLVIPRWEWAKGFAHTVASRDVATQILDAVGIAENAFNDGLVRGFIYGEKHTTAQADRVRQKAFNAVLKATGHTPGRYDGDDLYTFDRDDVYSFAGALHPAAVEVLKEADRRRAARLEQERRKAWEESHWEAGSVGMKV